ncbi:MAG: hypothetical protein M3Z00_04035 [Actinomycetota bacterium]|nr:hypothetical protein [Actinomycetota bacterium]
MTDRDDSLDQSDQRFDSRRQRGQQQDLPPSGSGGSSPIRPPAGAQGVGQPVDARINDPGVNDSGVNDSGVNDSEATSVVPRRTRATSDDDASAGAVYPGPSGQPNSRGGLIGDPPTSEYPATQHFHTPADQDPTQALPQPAGSQPVYGAAVSDPYSTGAERTDLAGRSDVPSSYRHTAGAAEPGYRSTQSGFFSPQGAQQPVRVEVKPASLRFGHNLAGGLLGIVLAAGTAALYVLVTKNHQATEAPSTGLKLALIGLAILLAIPGLIAGWAPAAAWFPGLILAVVGTAAVMSGWVTNQIVSLSNKLFNSPLLAQFVVPWALVGGWALLLAGIGAQMARRSATTTAMDRIVHS